ncbi:MAG: carotenoid 1,2-hydratase [Deltaproteobacteria bacterium]|nr:carotenoid 1,2-hydratase [Deltaproteobacteria bacterium]
MKGKILIKGGAAGYLIPIFNQRVAQAFQPVPAQAKACGFQYSRLNAARYEVLHADFTPTPTLPPQGGGRKRWANPLFNYRLPVFIKRLEAIPFLFLVILLVVLAPRLATAGPEFEIPKPGRVFQFPRDHGAHPRYKTEWWYYTGHLRAKDGESFGYQLTFFRAGLKKPDSRARSAWALHTVYFAHLALSDATRKNFIFREKANRGALGLAGTAEGNLKVWIDAWSAEVEGNAHHLQAQDGDLGMDLILTPIKPPVLHGDAGFSRKAVQGEAASYYYSLTRMETRGRILLGERTLEVTGSSWMDHEFFTHTLAPEQAGWDWFALQLEDGWEVMLYLLRHQDGKIDPASSGTLIDPEGQGRHLKLAEFKLTPTNTWRSPPSQALYPAAWKLEIPSAGLSLTLIPTLADQEIRAGEAGGVTYWEGQIKVQGQRQQQPVTGQGYAELTGYAGKLGGMF